MLLEVLLLVRLILIFHVLSFGPVLLVQLRQERLNLLPV